jgi:tetratricopeptide (TPR) repeat protein
MGPAPILDFLERHEIGAGQVVRLTVSEVSGVLIVITCRWAGQFAGSTFVVVFWETAGNFLDSLLQTMDRIATLNEILTENPKDAFARYGLAMEYSKQGDFDRALAEFSILLENHADYTAGYFMAAQTLVRAERIDDARKMLHDGIASARRTGNLHAQSEMEGLLAELG